MNAPFPSKAVPGRDPFQGNPLAGVNQAGEFACLFTQLIGTQLALDALALIWEDPIQQGAYSVLWKNGAAPLGPQPFAIDLNGPPAEWTPRLSAYTGSAWLQIIPITSSGCVYGLIVLGNHQPKELQPAEEGLLRHFSAVSGEMFSKMQNASHLTQSLQRVRKPHFLGKSRQIESKMRQVARNAPGIILQIDRQYQVIFANRSETGVDRSDLIGKTIFELFDEDFHRVAREALQRVFETGKPEEREIQIDRDPDYPKWVMARLSPVSSSGRVDNIVLLVTDISQRKKKEQALERYKLLAENAHEMIIFVRAADERIIDANLATLKMYGYSRAELAQMHVSDFRVPSERAAVQAHLQQAKDGSITVETVHMRKDGTTFPVEVSAQGIDLAGERVVMSIIRDISERREAETRLQRQVQENLRLLLEAQRRTQELEVIAHLSASLRHAQSQAEILQILVRKTAEAMDTESVSILLIEDNLLWLAAGIGNFQPLTGMRFPQSNGPLWDVVRTGETLVLQAPFLPDNADLFLQYIAGGFTTLALIPIKASDSTFGIQVIGYPSAENPFHERSSLATAFAEIAGNTLQRTNIRERLEVLVANRAKELEAVYDITSVATESLDMQVALQRALEHLLQAMRCLAGAIYLLDETETSIDLFVQSNLPPDVVKAIRQVDLENSLEGRVIRANEPLIIPDMTASGDVVPNLYPEMLLSLVEVPMRVQGKVVGVLSVCGPSGHPFGIDELALLSAIADHIGLIVENARLHQRAETAAVMEERSRLARELHDSVTQSLYSLTLYANAGKTLAQKGEIASAQNYMTRVGEIAQQALKEMRLLVYELRPTILDQDGLVGALQQRLDAVESRSGVQASITAENLPALPLRVEECLYRIALEALNNTLKHAHASQVAIQIQMEGKEIVRLAISDNGCGFKPEGASEKGGLGLLSMLERAEKINGILTIDSAPGQGTVITVNVPVH